MYSLMTKVHENISLPPKNAAVKCSSHLVRIKSITIKPWILVPKAESSEMSDKILSLVTQYPDWGPKKISGFLMLEGVSLSSHTIYKFLVRRNLNHTSLRKQWKYNQKESK